MRMWFAGEKVLFGNTKLIARITVTNFQYKQRRRIRCRISILAFLVFSFGGINIDVGQAYRNLIV